jgi:hypothetical protein
MCNSRGGALFLILLHSVVVALVSAQGSNKTSLWRTLSGLCSAQTLLLSLSLYFSLINFVLCFLF